MHFVTLCLRHWGPTACQAMTRKFFSLVHNPEHLYKSISAQNASQAECVMCDSVHARPSVEEVSWQIMLKNSGFGMPLASEPKPYMAHI